jgi:outer membrane protein assembly factor BamB
MLKKAAMLGALVAIAGAALYVAGVRVALDGSGMRPRFVSRGPNYDVLDADRARQRERAMPQTGPIQGAAPLDRGPALRQAQGIPSTSADQRQALQSDVMAASKTTAIGSSRRGYWPDFRGPRRDGRYDETAIRTDWPGEGLPRLWKQPIGLGYASFVVAGGRAFTIEQRRQQEVVSAYDVDTGRELWTHGWPGAFVESMGGDGPRATPTYHEGRVYALGALGELQCLDARSGALVWRRNILTDNAAPNVTWGMSAAPLVVDGKVIVLPGGPNGKSVVAYDAATGAPIWTSLDDPQAYTSPMLVTLAGIRQILVVSARRAVGLTVDEGRLLWEYPWVTEMSISVAQPLLLENDRVFLSAAYGHGAAVFEVARTNDGFTTRTIWANNRMKNKFTSSVLREGYIYGLDESILACLDAATGELKWKGGRYGYGQVILAGDRLVVLTEDGDVALVKATPERFEQEAKFPAISGKTWNHPVIADGRLLVRNLREMAAFDIRPR